MIKVSVISICFNAAKTIEETINSVIRQDYPELEYIIIDGGATDGTIEAKLTENVEFIPLEDKEKWIETIERMIIVPKTDNTEQIRKAGYVIKKQHRN